MLSPTIKTSLKFSIVTLTGVILGAAGMSYHQKEQGPRRSVASLHAYQPRGLIIGKQGAAMTVELVGPENYPDNNTETVEIVAYITQHLSSTGPLSYAWNLPVGVTVVQGPLSSTLPHLVLGKPFELRLLVQGFSTERQKMISLKTELSTGSDMLVASANIVSRPDDTVEARVMELKAQAKAAAEEAATENR